MHAQELHKVSLGIDRLNLSRKLVVYYLICSKPLGLVVDLHILVVAHNQGFHSYANNVPLYENLIMYGY